MTAAGFAGALAGVALLREAWRRRPGPRAGLIIAGWAAVFGSAVALIRGFGGDIGAAVWALAVAFCGLAAIAWSADRTPRRKARATPRRQTSPAEDPATGAAAGPWRTTAVVALAGPAAMIPAFLTGLAITAQGAGATADRMMTGAVVTPLVWGAAMAWVCADRSLARSCGLLVGLTALAGIILLISQGGAA